MGFKGHNHVRPAPSRPLIEDACFFPSTYLPRLPLNKKIIAKPFAKYFLLLCCCCCFFKGPGLGPCHPHPSLWHPIPDWKWETILRSSTSWYMAYFPLRHVFKEPKVKRDRSFYLKSEQFPGCCIKIQPTVFTEMCLFYSKIKAFLF